MRSMRIVLLATAAAFFALAPPARPADSENSKGEAGTGQVLPRPQGIDPVRVDLKQGFQAHQMAELNTAIAALEERLRDLQREKQRELQYKKEILVQIESLMNVVLAQEALSRWKSELGQTNGRIAMLELRIAETENSLEAKKAEKAELMKKVREAEAEGMPSRAP